MGFGRFTSPEILYGDTARKARALRDISERFAEEGDTLSAVYAQWAADMFSVQSLAWERIMVASPNPESQFFAVAGAVSRAMAIAYQRPRSVRTAKDVIVNARDALGYAFDESMMRALNKHFTNADHLSFLPPPKGSAPSFDSAGRLNGATPAEYAVEKHEEAVTNMGYAWDSLQSGAETDAIAWAYQADLASFERYLVEAAIAVGDHYLTTVNVRWNLASEMIGQLDGLPGDLNGSTFVIRELLKDAVGVVDGSRLNDFFEPVPVV
jgi:hypothetical protein